MVENSLPVLMPRLDFAWMTSLHVMYLIVTIGLAWLLFVMEIAWLRTKNEKWYRLVRFFEKIFIINFGAGVATGVTCEFSFGILFGPFSQAVGPFFGSMLGFETITAFMYEAGFIGLMIFGWGKVGKGMHLFSTFNVALSASLSAFWIMIANSWMQTPNGIIYKDGLFQVTNWWNAIFNQDFLWAFPHMWVATLETSLFFLAAMSAYMIYKNRYTDVFVKVMKPVFAAMVVVTALQIFLGDGLGRIVYETQPTVLAAMEGHYHTYRQNGEPNTSWNLIAIPNGRNDDNLFTIAIPQVLSLLENHTINSTVKGLDSFPKNDRPDVWIPFYSFRMMVAIGFFLFFVAVWGFVLSLKGRFTESKLPQNKFFLKVVMISGFLPYLAVWGGWWTREVGRQPWLVFNMMRTYQGVSHMTVGQGIFWLIGYIIIELIVWAATWYYFTRVLQNGLDHIPPSSTLFNADGSAAGGHYGGNSQILPTFSNKPAFQADRS